MKPQFDFEAMKLRQKEWAKTQIQEPKPKKVDPFPRCKHGYVTVCPSLECKKR